MPAPTPQTVDEPDLQVLLDRLVDVALEDRAAGEEQRLARLRRREVYEEIFRRWPDRKGLTTTVAAAAGVTPPAVIQVRNAILAEAEPGEYAGTGGEQ